MTDTSMHADAPHRHARRHTRRLIAAAHRTFRDIVEGWRAARRYEALAALSDSQLAGMGLNRADLPHVVMFGRSPVAR